MQILIDLLFVVALAILPIIPGHFLGDFVTPVVVIYPMIPAYVIFKYLPAKGVTWGAFQGVHFRFAGAFAGYLVVFLLLYFRPPTCQSWEVRGVLELNPPGNVRTTTILYRPPDPIFNENGTFSTRVYTEGSLPKLLTLVFLRDGYETSNVGLDPSSSGSFGLAPYTIDPDYDHKTLTIKEHVRMNRATGP